MASHQRTPEVMQNVSFVVVFWWVFLHSHCQNYSFLPRLPSSSRTSTTHFLVKDATTEAIPCNGLIVWQHDTTVLYTCFFHSSDSGGAATWFHRKKKGWLLGCSGETNGKHAAISDNQLDDCGCQHWTFQGPKTTSWSGFNGKFGGSRWNEGRKVQGFTQKLDQKSTRPRGPAWTRTCDMNFWICRDDIWCILPDNRGQRFCENAGGRKPLKFGWMSIAVS